MGGNLGRSRASNPQTSCPVLDALWPIPPPMQNMKVLGGIESGGSPLAAALKFLEVAGEPGGPRNGPPFSCCLRSQCCFSCRKDLMALPGPAAHVLLLTLMVLPELSPAGSLGPGIPARNLPKNHINLPSPALWTPPAGHHHRRGLGKKERGPGRPSRVHNGALVTTTTTTRQASRLPVAGERLPGQSPPSLLQEKDLFLDLALPYPEKDNRSPGPEKARKRGREHKRRRERLRLHRGS